jgi:hypothetical protein
MTVENRLATHPTNRQAARFVLSFAAKNWLVNANRTNGFVGTAEGHHRTARLKMPTSALANKSLAETHKTRHSRLIYTVP